MRSTLLLFLVGVIAVALVATGAETGAGGAEADFEEDWAKDDEPVVTKEWDKDDSRHPLHPEVERLGRKAEKLARHLSRLEDATFVDMSERRKTLELARRHDNDLVFYQGSTCGSVRNAMEKLSRDVHDLRRKVQTSEDLSEGAGRQMHKTQHQRMAALNTERLKKMEAQYMAAMLTNDECDRLKFMVESLKPRLNKLFDDAASPQAEGDM